MQTETIPVADSCYRCRLIYRLVSNGNNETVSISFDVPGVEVLDSARNRIWVWSALVAISLPIFSIAAGLILSFRKISHSDAARLDHRKLAYPMVTNGQKAGEHFADLSGRLHGNAEQHNPGG